MLAPAHPRDRVVHQRPSAPEERQPLRKLHSQLMLAELTEDVERAKRLLARAPSQYRAVHVLVSFLPRVLRECEAERCAERVRVGDAPSDELDAIDAEEEDDTDSDVEEECAEGEPAAAILGTADEKNAHEHAEQPKGVATVTQPAQEPAMTPVTTEVAEPPLAWRSIRSVRNAMLSAARAEKRAAAKSAAASKRLKKLDAQAAAAQAAASAAADAATAAARAVNDAMSMGGQAAKVAARAAERYGALADAQALLATSRRNAALAQTRAARAQEAAMGKVRKTYLLIARAGVAYDDFVSKAILTRAGHDSPRGVAARPAADEANEDEEGHGLAPYLGEPVCSGSQQLVEVDPDDDADRMAAFMADPTVRRVSRLGEGELLAIATDWSLRDRVQTWCVCDRRSPIPPWVRSRELVMLEIRWRMSQAELPADFERRASTFESNQGVMRRQRTWGLSRARSTEGADGDDDESAVELMPVEACGSEPMSGRDLVDELGGNQTSGHQRASMDREVLAAVAQFYELAHEFEDTDERAAILLLHMVARDADYEPAEWMKELFAAHREALDETFHRADYGRQTEYDGGSERDGERGEATATRKKPPRMTDLPKDTLAEIASLYVEGKVSQAANLAGMRPWELHHRRSLNGPFKVAYREAVRFHTMQEAAQ
ncbi:MAG: hypothetical protein RLZZ450_313 [Pseudomonadota bacterium]|jgi:hypothetical protein